MAFVVLIPPDKSKTQLEQSQRALPVFRERGLSPPACAGRAWCCSVSAREADPWVQTLPLPGPGSPVLCVSVSPFVKWSQWQCSPLGLQQGISQAVSSSPDRGFVSMWAAVMMLVEVVLTGTRLCALHRHPRQSIPEQPTAGHMHRASRWQHPSAGLKRGGRDSYQVLLCSHTSALRCKISSSTAEPWASGRFTWV